MPEYLTPGVYTEEIEGGAKSIEGVSTSTAAFIGKTERGSLKPRLVTNFDEYRHIFGGYISDSYLTYAVDGFFRNGGKRCIVSRIVGKGIKTASAKIKDQKGSQNLIKIEARGPGDSGSNIAYRIEGGSQYDKDAKEPLSLFKIIVGYFSNKDEKGKLIYKDPEVLEIYDDVSRNDNLSNSFKRKINPTSNLVYLWHDSQKDPNTLVEFTPESEWVPLTLGEGPKPFATLIDKNKKIAVTVTGKKSFKNNQLFIKVKKVDESKKTFNVEVKFFETPTEDPESTPTKEESEKSISMTPADANFVEKTKFEHVELKRKGNDMPVVLETWIPLSAPKDESIITLNDYEGKEETIMDPADNTNTQIFHSGLSGLKAIDDISLVCAPGGPTIDYFTELQKRIISYCDKNKNCFAITQLARDEGVPSNFAKLRPYTDSKYAAAYLPWLVIRDPKTDNPKVVPPCGHIAGIYARSDVARGVHKAPANEGIRGITSLQLAIDQGKQALLNPRGLNVIRTFPGRGQVVWGARTISTDPNWKYINVRRLFIFIEKSIERSTQWAVFEPNNEALWKRITATLTGFLIGVHRTGALMGKTPAEGFFVRCDRTTMSQDDLDNGRLVCYIGLAATKPAEFVVFRLAQTRAGATLEELL